MEDFIEQSRLTMHHDDKHKVTTSHATSTATKTTDTQNTDKKNTPSISSLQK